jgi:serine/threonine-protein kinase RIO1
MQEAINQMKILEVSMGSEIKMVDEIKVSIIKRVAQVHGDLYEYNPLEDQNILRVKDVFLCLD